MTKEQAIKMIKAKRECIELDTNGNAELCDRNCGECKLNYEQGNMGEQKEALDMAINALEQQPIAEERYQDLVEYFGDKDVAKCILEDREEFKKWLDRIKWYIRKADELARKLEQQPSEDCVSRAELKKWLDMNFSFGGALRKLEMFDQIDKELPPVTPTHGTCIDCKWWDSENNNTGYCNACKHGHWSSTWDIGIYRKTKADFYCADFEKRGSEK